jgi:HTH-type transcriptional regulator, transcriptional repressor of NAD biosynthesis genes
MPPHQGHLCVVDFARHYVDRLTVVIATLDDDPIPGELRSHWMRELFPGVQVVQLTDANPQSPQEHPEFWKIWRESLARVVEGKVDWVFGLATHGERLAQELGAQFLPTLSPRPFYPIGSTQLRNFPWAHWDALPRPVRPYFVGRIAVLGPHGTGKTTLAEQLAQHFQTVAVPDFSRAWRAARGGPIEAKDMQMLVRGQKAAEEALALQANRLLFCDGDALLIRLRSLEWFGQPVEADTGQFAHYPLTLLTEEGGAFHEPELVGLQTPTVQQWLEQHERPYVLLRGSWAERWARAVKAMNELLERGTDA